MRIEKTHFAADNLIEIIYDLAAHVEIQREALRLVADEIGRYSFLAQEVYAGPENSREIGVEILNIAQTGNAAGQQFSKRRGEN